MPILVKPKRVWELNPWETLRTRTMLGTWIDPVISAGRDEEYDVEAAIAAALRSAPCPLFEGLDDDGMFLDNVIKTNCSDMFKARLHDGAREITRRLNRIQEEMDMPERKPTTASRGGWSLDDIGDRPQSQCFGYGLALDAQYFCSSYSLTPSKAVPSGESLGLRLDDLLRRMSATTPSNASRPEPSHHQGSPETDDQLHAEHDWKTTRPPSTGGWLGVESHSPSPEYVFKYGDGSDLRGGSGNGNESGRGSSGGCRKGLKGLELPPCIGVLVTGGVLLSKVVAAAAQASGGRTPIKVEICEEDGCFILELIIGAWLSALLAYCLAACAKLFRRATTSYKRRRRKKRGRRQSRRGNVAADTAGHSCLVEEGRAHFVPPSMRLEGRITLENVV